MLTVDWKNKIIHVPQSYHTNLGGGVYEMDLNQFRLDLKDLEDDEAGISFPTTHTHNTTVNFGGVTLARTIEIINGYTVTFEDVGQPYIVNLVGANSNVSDVTNVNNVSVRSFNSGGLVQQTGAVTQADLNQVKADLEAEIKKRLTLGQFIALK